MRSHEYWRDRATSHIFAIELIDGVVTASCGPLAASDVDPAFLAGHPFSNSAAAELEQRRSEFDVLSEAELLLLSAAAD